MIEVNNLVKKIGDKMILRNLKLTVAEGETIAVLGPNGAGKTTLLKTIATLTKPTSGDVKIFGLTPKDSILEIRQNIGYLPHASLLYDHFSPLENLVFYGKLYGVKDVENRSKALIEQVGLKFFTNEPVRGFSRGMIQRTAIARAIIHDPKLLLLDEPHTGLDQKAISILNDVIHEKKKDGLTTLMVTHDIKQAAAVCDRAIVIQNGRVTGDFKMSGMTEEELLSKYHEFVGGEA